MNLRDLIETISAKTDAVINIGVMEKTFSSIELLHIGLPNYHYGDYCQFAKINGNQSLCGKNKRRTKHLARHGKRFTGYCPFGVWDLVQPVFFQDELVAVIYIGSFQGKKPLQPINGKKYEGPELPKLTSEKKRLVAYYAKFLAEFIQLAYQRWVDEGNKLKKKEDANCYRSLVERFIDNHYHRPCQLSELAESLSMNPNYLGELIHRIFNKSFNQLLAEYRINEAKVNLRSYQHMRISAVAYQCGFNDSNYFSTVFKKFTGMTPRQYRRAERSQTRP